jgi:hypothetical protein
VCQKDNTALRRPATRWSNQPPGRRDRQGQHPNSLADFPFLIFHFSSVISELWEDPTRFRLRLELGLVPAQKHKCSI